MGPLKKYLALAATFALMIAAVALVYQAAARDRDYRALLARGDLAVRQEQTFGAIEAYSGAIALRPESMLPYLRRGEAYQRRGELDQAARDFRLAGALDPTATRPIEALGDVFYAMTRFDRAADSYGRYLQLDDRSAAVNYKLALALYRTGDIDAALKRLDSTLRIDNELADAYYLRGLCLRDRRLARDAVAAFERAVAIAPNHLAAREELADLYGAANRRNEEIEQLERIADLDREQVERQVALGLAQARAGREEAAVRTLGQALERAPAPALYRALGQVWLAQAQKQDDPISLSKALEALGRIVSGPDTTSEILTLYGRALLMNGQFEAAELALLQASTRYPLDASSLVLYATVAERQGHLDASRQALIDYAGLVADAPDAVPHALRIADLSLRLNDPDTAVSWLERALRLAPDDLLVLGHLGDAQLRAGDRAGAEATIARGLAKDPASATFLGLSRRLKRSG
jgi:tetratricopeptide (TPR) repeat protein